MLSPPHRLTSSWFARVERRRGEAKNKSEANCGVYQMARSDKSCLTRRAKRYGRKLSVNAGSGSRTVSKRRCFYEISVKACNRVPDFVAIRGLEREEGTKQEVPSSRLLCHSVLSSVCEVKHDLVVTQKPLANDNRLKYQQNEIVAKSLGPDYSPQPF